MELFDVYPLQDIEIVKGKGVYVWDSAEQAYLDMYGGHAVISIGHTHPHWVEKIEQQLNNLAFYSNSVQLPIQKQLAKKLGEISNKEPYQLFLCNSGAEANENALKIASFYKGRKKIISFSKAFHGRTSLAVAATDNKNIVAPVNETDNIVFLPYNDKAALQAYFEKNGTQVAAVIIETIQGVGGIVEAENDFLQLIRTLCTQYEAVFIADEIQCGYGRTGKFFALDNFSIEADIYTMAKGMGNGFPIGGILLHPKFLPKHGLLGTTFGGNPLACAAALAVLEVFEKENLIENAAAVGDYLKTALSAIPSLKNIRGCGLMIGFDMPENQPNLKKDLLSKAKVFTGEAKPNTIRLLPALSITKQEADIFIERLKSVME